MEDLPINADTVNKTLDMIDETTKETRKEIDKTAAKGMNKLAQLIWASPLGRRADIYIAERPYKMQVELEKMQAKYEAIPIDYQVEPSSYIALKGVNELNYCLEEEHLKEMFENLLISDMDSRKKGRVLPAYIEIVKQLSKEDAKFLKLFENYNTNNFALLFVRHSITSSPNYMARELVLDENNVITLNSIIVDNLERLNLIKLYNDRTISNTQMYTTGFNLAEKKYEQPGFFSIALDYDGGSFVLTDLGRNFIDICLS